jgi:1,2-diacylglycerol 3-beta-galactosyltransferase
VARVVAAYRPAMIVSFHPMTSEPAVRVRERTAQLLPVVTVITDLITTHLSWRDAAVDRVIVPAAAIASRCHQDGMRDGHYVEIGLPVVAEFCRPPATLAERSALRRSLGLAEQFLVVVTGGAEGSGGIHRRTAAILRQLKDVNVAVICGRNESPSTWCRRARADTRHGHPILSVPSVHSAMIRRPWPLCAGHRQALPGLARLPTSLPC